MAFFLSGKDNHALEPFRVVQPCHEKKLCEALSATPVHYQELRDSEYR